MKSIEKMIDGERKHICLCKWKNDACLSDLASLVAQMVKNLPAMQEIQVQSLFGKIPWGEEWLPTLVLLPRKFHGQRNLAGYSPCGHKDRTWLSD